MSNKNSDQVNNYYKGRGGYRGPYHEYDNLILSLLKPGMNLLDIGCGRTFPMAPKWLSTGANIYGVDPEANSSTVPEKTTIISGRAEKINCDDQKFDIIISRAVLEHIEKPEKVFKELHRLLKTGGKIVLLAPSKYDYISMAARLIPNRYHAKIVKATEGRDEADTFPTFYQANSYKQIKQLAYSTNLTLVKFEYLDQSPSALHFNPILYKLGCLYHFLIRSIPMFHFLKGWFLCILTK